MRKKSSEALQREATEILREAKRLRALEATREKQDARYRQCLLGVCLEQEMVKDPTLRSRIEAVMQRFCTRTRDRELFRLDQSESWFAALARGDSAAAKTARPSKVPAGRAASESAPPGSAVAAKGVDGLPRVAGGGSAGAAASGGLMAAQGGASTPSLDGARVGGESPQAPGLSTAGRGEGADVRALARPGAIPSAHASDPAGKTIGSSSLGSVR